MSWHTTRAPIPELATVLLLIASELLQIDRANTKRFLPLSNPPRRRLPHTIVGIRVHFHPVPLSLNLVRVQLSPLGCQLSGKGLRRVRSPLMTRRNAHREGGGRVTCAFLFSFTLT